MEDFDDTVYHAGWLMLLIMVAIPGGWDWFDTLTVGAATLLLFPMVWWDWRARQERLAIQQYFDEAAEHYTWDDCDEGCCRL